METRPICNPFAQKRGVEGAPERDAFRGPCMIFHYGSSLSQYPSPAAPFSMGIIQ